MPGRTRNRWSPSHLLSIVVLGVGCVVAACAGGQALDQPDASPVTQAPSCQDYCTAETTVCADHVSYTVCVRDADSDPCFEMSTPIACPAHEVCNPATNACCAPSCTGVAAGGSDGCGGTCPGGTCTPSCSGKHCGDPDGCGSFCNDTSTCTSTCTPTCAGRTCGSSDGCGGTCTENNSTCTTACVPSCAGKDCGQPDDCGGQCTEGNSTCTPDPAPIEEVNCGESTCWGGTVCCVGWTNLSSCFATDACFLGTLWSISCDGPEDCTGGHSCCIGTTPETDNARCSATTTTCEQQVDQATVCHTDADCPASAPTCGPYSGGRIRVCH